jgi:uncharacterized iron-regulated membrane protein
VRDVLVHAHRWVGLATAAFLTIAGLTGSVIAFRYEVDAWLNPDLFAVAADGRAPLAASALVTLVERADPRVRVESLPLRFPPGQSAIVYVAPRIDPESGRPFAPGYNQVFVDPADGTVLGTRSTHACCFDRRSLIPFLHRFHYNLYLPGNWGVWLMGGIAVAWVVDCFVGLLLTFPRGRRIFARWSLAWRIKRGAGAHRLNFDLHRAGGLWFWIILLAVAVSSVYLNLRDEVFKPAVELFSPVTPTVAQSRPRQPPSPVPVLSVDIIAASATAEAQRRGWEQAATGIAHNASRGMYVVFFRPSLSDEGTGLGSPRLYYDDRNGRMVGDAIPGRGTAGDLFFQLQYPLHSGQIAGLAGRIAVSVGGVAIAVLSVTGVVIWWRKRHARIRRRDVRTGRLAPRV